MRVTLQGQCFDRPTFVLGDAYYYYYCGSGQFDLVERIPPNALVINGTANGTLSPSGISGTLSGVVALTNRQTAPFWPVHVAMLFAEPYL